MPQLPARQKNGPAQPLLTPKFSLGDITGKGPSLPNRLILHATEGWGKTSFGAMAPNPVFIMTKGETGLQTLIDAKQLPETPHFPECMSFADINGALDFLLVDEHPFRTLVLDTLNGAEQLCHQHTCDTYFGGDWSDNGFASYGKGYLRSLEVWRELLAKIDRVRIEKRMTIICLCHTGVSNFKNPEGSDFDRYMPKLYECKTFSFWEPAKQWADIVLFGHYEMMAIGRGGKEETDPTKKGKGVGGTDRILLTQRTAAYDAKNRLGLKEEIDCGESPQQAWTAFVTEAKAAKERGLPNG